MPKIAITAFAFGDGGTERMLVHLARGFAELGCTVDFLMENAEGPYLDTLRGNARLLEIAGQSRKERTASLCRYLAVEKPDVLLSGKRSDEEAVAARTSGRSRTKVFLRIGTTVSARDRNRSPFKSWKTRRKLRRLIPRADGVIAVSHGVAQDIRRLLDNQDSPIHVVPNPVITPEMELLAKTPPDHPFFSGDQTPVIMGMGGLRRAKDFPTLLRAFSRVLDRRPSRLIILGAGRQKEKLNRLAGDLGILSQVSFPGFVENPYAFLARASVFVLSSLWEGSPNVLTEALAVGTPVVSTDCPSGPREILKDGTYGLLVPCGDPESMAVAILETLDNPPSKAFLQEAVQDYTLLASAEKYLEAFGFNIS